jgi:hypothetical protein
MQNPLKESKRILRLSFLGDMACALCGPKGFPPGLRCPACYLTRGNRVKFTQMDLGRERLASDQPTIAENASRRLREMQQQDRLFTRNLAREPCATCHATAVLGEHRADMGTRLSLRPCKQCRKSPQDRYLAEEARAPTRREKQAEPSEEVA